MEIHGKNHIGFTLSSEGSQFFNAVHQPSMTSMDEKYYSAWDDEIDEAINLADRAFFTLKKVNSSQRAEFLEAIADEILDLGDDLVKQTMAETGLPEARIIGERGRTMNQLKMFADLIRQGDWVEASIDTAQPDRSPIPKPDLRMMRRPVGTVVVFTASNFPLAFSTAGGDTASALAAGNPVIVKCHESHPGTNSLVSDAIIRAAKKTKMPEGVYSSLQGSGYSLGEKLVKHPLVKSVAFTGSFKGGMALQKLASEREEPIPVFAEMGSVNPSFIYKGLLNKDTGELAEQMASSILLGVGQFCTNPGVIVLEKSAVATQFQHHLASKIAQADQGIMLNEGIQKAYHTKLDKIFESNEVNHLTAYKKGEGNMVNAILASVSATDFIQNPELQEEIFGPYSLVVEADTREEFEMVAAAMSGQLTSTIWCTPKEIKSVTPLMNILEERSGRVIFNGVPTGVEVCPSMHHGGPYPATTDSRFTSVGTDAIKRFSRPVCWQNCPENLLPDELKLNNPLGIMQRINGKYS